ncbi:AT-hook motif nuclear-localized protein 8-like [Cucurbita pepo subsp. pepo]|uniref:AT-hook motif nuclear-localized protein 8-like n=1 Tax=Cucurbita pepo subsp. pepo TaxID=3664 RepID=UPI000C9D8A43|nr:AT-hook motif nuclear-localized protein 8-like [Cucurbita pepo subsp. pepo]
MDSRDTPPPPLSAPSNMAIGGPSAYSTAMTNANNNASSNMALFPPTSQMMPPSARFPFKSVISPASLHLDSMNASPYDGTHSGNFNVDSGKKRRGRPRKYDPDGNIIALGLAPTTVVTSSVVHGDLSATPDLEQPVRKPRGRPRGSGKKQTNALGSSGTSFTPYAVLAKPGEDVVAKILSYSQQGTRTAFILSANGTISNATLRHSALSGGSVTYKGQFEIISLSGPIFPLENNETGSRTGGLNVLLAGSDGQVLGGGVAGMLMAGSQVQVIVGNFLEDDKNFNTTSMLNSGSSSAPLQMMNFGGGGGGDAASSSSAVAAAAAASPRSLGASSGESSAENGESPLNNRHPGMFNNNNNTSQPMHNNNQMYHQLWSGQTQQ